MSAAAAAGKPDYGLDSPRAVRAMFSRGVWTLAFALLVFYINHTQYPAVSARVLTVLGLIAAAFIAVGYVKLWSSRVAKFRVRDSILSSLELNGSEKVLDLDGSAGLMSVGAAKQLKSGRVTTVDVFGEADAARENAKAEGVVEKVRVDSIETPKLVYPDGNFDVVLSALALHRISDGRLREQAVQEMWRVLKPGGKLAIFDSSRTSEYAELLRDAGAQNVELSPLSFLWCQPTRTVTARK
jgi:SAM-dependent methyltransferase